MAIWVQMLVDDGELHHEFERQAPDSWPSVPRPGEGIADSRLYLGSNLRVDRVWWSFDGDVTIYCAKVEHPELADTLLHEGWTRRGEPRPTPPQADE
jgi:hypothetical protein